MSTCRVIKNPEKQGKSAKKARQQKVSLNYWMYGLHACEAAWRNSKRMVHQLQITQALYNKVWQAWSGVSHRSTVAPQIVGRDVIDAHFPEGSVHQGIAIRVSPLRPCAIKEVQGAPLLVALDQVMDPHNIGAVLRSAAAFGATAVLLPKAHYSGETAVMAKASSGAIERVPIIAVSNLVSAMQQLQKAGHWCVGLDGGGEASISTLPDFQKVVILMGSEGTGLRQRTRECCDMLARIPMVQGAVESLNVSNAAAVAMYAVREKMVSK